MKKQSLIKYPYALFLVLVLLISSKNMAIAETSTTLNSPASQATTTPSVLPTRISPNVPSTNNNSMWFPLGLSIITIAANGVALALIISEIKTMKSRIKSQDEKHTNKITSIDDKYELLHSQVTSKFNQQCTTSIRSSTDSPDINILMLTKDNENLSERISELENKLQLSRTNEQSIKSSYQSRNIETNINSFIQTANLSQPDITQPLENLAYIELVNIYNTNPKLLEQRAIKVAEATESISRRHTDSSQKIVLEKANNSNYWVVHDDAGTTCWLLPKNKLKIDQYRYETTKALFECHGYHPEYSTFKLVKPAKVIPLSSDEQTWQLEEPGILEFSVEA